VPASPFDPVLAPLFLADSACTYSPLSASESSCWNDWLLTIPQRPAIPSTLWSENSFNAIHRGRISGHCSASAFSHQYGSKDSSVGYELRCPTSDTLLFLTTSLASQQNFRLFYHYIIPAHKHNLQGCKSVHTSVRHRKEKRSRRRRKQSRRGGSENLDPFRLCHQA